MSAEMVGRRLGWSASKVSRIETARIGVSMPDVRALLKLYKADEQQRDETLSLTQEASRQGWWADYSDIQQGAVSTFIAFEDEASSALYFQTEIVPGLLQAEEYARRLITSVGEIVPLTPTTIRRRIDARLRRQRVIYPPRSLPLTVVLDEAVLLRLIGTPVTMVRQLERLIELARLPNITVHVLPLDGNHGPGLSSFILLEFEPAFDVTFPSMVHIESSTALNTQDEAVATEHRLVHQWLVSQCLNLNQSLIRISDIASRHWAPKIG